MSFSQYAHSSLRLRQQWARRNPAGFLAIETGRGAAMMALVLAIAEITPLSLRSGEHGARLGFIMVWAVLMAAWNLSRARRSNVGTPTSRPPTI